jgi:hypothetical protein
VELFRAEIAPIALGTDSVERVNFKIGVGHRDEFFSKHNIETYEQL